LVALKRIAPGQFNVVKIPVFMDFFGKRGFAPKMPLNGDPDSHYNEMISVFIALSDRGP
jgi:hypothetical protein